MKKFSVSILCFGVCFLSAAFGSMKPVDVRCGEFFDNPLGYDLSGLSFSWKLPAIRQGIMQTAYRIVVADSEENLEKNPVWDSGKVVSDRSVKVPYGGAEISAARAKYFYKVAFWDEKGGQSEWSDVKTFEFGLLKNSDWVAKWISSGEKPVFRKEIRPMGEKRREVKLGGDKPAYMRKEFSLGSAKIKKARAYISTLGIFQLYINGKKVGRDFWGTGWTDYGVRVQAQTYDVSGYLRSGGNAVGVLLGGGWYAGRSGFLFDSCTYGDDPKLLLQLEVEFEDGTVRTVATDASWKWSRGAVVSADIFEGEVYDARLQQDGWNDAATPRAFKNLWGLFGDGDKFDDSGWREVKVENIGELPAICPNRAQPIVVKETLYPVSVRKVGARTYIFDLGQNIVGWPKIKVPSMPGREITIRYAEMLKSDGHLYTENYRTAKSTDTFICGKYGVAEYEPSLTFHGFRYVELGGLPEEIEASADWLEGKVVFSDLELIGSFVCSDAKVNQLQSNIQWGQRCNFFSIPTDCPQRDERLGWTGDAQVFVPTAAFNMNVDAFFSKWLTDVRDGQSDDGAYPDIAPKKRNLTGWFKNRGNAAWADAGVICTWEVYRAYGGEKILRDNYEAMKKWIAFMERTSKNYIRPETAYGDWLQPYAPLGRGDASKKLIGTAYFVRDVDIMAKIARILGHSEDAARFDALGGKVRAAFNAAYLKPDGTVDNDCQTSYLLALAFDILPENMRAAAFEKFLKTLERADYHLRTGFVGTPLINAVLTKFGRSDLAYRLLFTETYPSWLYTVNQGATTMWERWNSFSKKDGFGDANMNSFNHYAYGAIGQWLYGDVAGLWNDESAAGYKNIVFAPKTSEKLSFASASLETPYGRAASSWRRSDGVLEWTVAIPPNATGTLHLPTKKLDTVRVNGEPLNLRAGSDAAGGVLKGVKSGEYRILLRE